MCFHLPLCRLHMLQKIGPNYRRTGWAPQIPFRSLWIPWRGYSAIHLHLRYLQLLHLHLPAQRPALLLRSFSPVPWPDQRPSLVRRRSAMAFFCNVPSPLICIHICFLLTSLKSLLWLPPWQALHSSGRRLSWLKQVQLPRLSPTS